VEYLLAHPSPKEYHLTETQQGNGESMQRKITLYGKHIPIEFTVRWRRVLQSVSEVFEASSTCIIRQQTPTLEVVATNNNAKAPFQEGCIIDNAYQELFTPVLHHDLELFIDNIAQAGSDAAPLLAPLEIVSLYVVPIHWPGNKSFGMLCVMDEKPFGERAKHKCLMNTFQLLFENELHLLLEMHEREHYSRLFEGKKAELDEFSKELVRKETRIKELKTKLELSTSQRN